MVVTRAAANYALEDHWSDGVVQQDLKNGHYDLVIMQHGPATLAESGANLTQWVGTFAAEARKYGTRPAVYSVWAPDGGAFQDGITHYRAAADAADAAFYPVAQAWQETWRRQPSMPLYGPDGFHPSRHGALLAAMVITGVIFDLAPAKFDNLFPDQVSEGEAVVLRAAAAKAIREFGRR